ncbi:hypothetical protein, partial [Dyadobacter sp. LHD-138]|uniref:hypothetical protein n=1 Tax=Dyadobacter sp. LHD-138 TaxID=3071413 RepID=UPI0027DF1673
IAKSLFAYTLRLPLIVQITHFFCLIFHEARLPDIQIRSNTVFIGRILFSGRIDELNIPFPIHPSFTNWDWFINLVL